LNSHTSLVEMGTQWTELHALLGMTNSADYDQYGELSTSI